MRVHEFGAEPWFSLPPEEPFWYFADAGNLPAITLPWLEFRIITPLPVVMRAGTPIDRGNPHFGQNFVELAQSQGGQLTVEVLPPARPRRLRDGS